MASEFLTEKETERFWSKVDKTPGLGPNGDCWHWTAGTKNKEGYGGFYWNKIKNTLNSHKVAFCLAHNFAPDDLAEGYVIRHLCNNPVCVNPDHLKQGTHKDNSQDMVRAGNSLKGERGSRAVLTWEAVREIRAKWASGKHTKADLARAYGVGGPAIWQIVNNGTWIDESYVPANTRKGFVKFGDDVVASVRTQYAAGVPVATIIAKFKMSATQCYNILRGDQRKGGC